MSSVDTYSNAEELLYSVIELTTGPQDASLAVMYHGVRFVITAISTDLVAKDDDLHLQELLTLKDAIEDDFEAMQTLYDWMISPCSNCLQQLSPASTPKSMTLQDYFDPTTYAYRLVNLNGQVKAEISPYTEASLRTLSPRALETEPVVVTALAHGIPTICASKLQILRAEDAWENELNDMPRAVVFKDDIKGQKIAFKAVSDRASFRRELECLLMIKAQSQSQELLVPKLVGLATWEHENTIMGLLMQHIDHGDNLDSALHQASKSDRAKWAIQIRDALRELHAIEVVWGDVKPGNILIDSNNNAIIIDFGGGFSPHWVDPELQGTKAGDLQGVERLMEYMDKK
jgi:tRNA A-37 threonylcarbamoyl transferase component Bud32